ncbi:MAG: tRNA (adenosine(37)-N6)-threonylcarbamoyltransferase complex dimerization subunit type 1 TsaB [bacterium]|nr:tRNA (adenosine(37)-N6)-threonylcarbamoyltransferase complex dimerization subunit type 1 TsaB [bacterium]
MSLEAPLLSLCSASRIASVALLDAEKVVVEHAEQSSRHQAESLLPLVDRVLVETGVRVEALTGIGVSIGPGSFTSLRIGVATVKGLLFGTQKTVAPVSTLQALALAAGRGDGPVIATLDAQRGEVYAAAFDAGDFAARDDVLPELVYTADELAEKLPGGCRIVGEGAAIVGDRLRQRRGADAFVIEPEPAQPSAAQIGVLALAALAAGGGQSAAELVPRYVRRAEAEVTRTAERFEP